MTKEEAAAAYVAAANEEAAAMVETCIHERVYGTMLARKEELSDKRQKAFEKFMTILNGETNEKVSNHADFCSIYSIGKCNCKFDP